MAILLIYMFLLRYLAQWVIWLSLILCIITFALASGFCFTARNRIQKYLNTNQLPNLDEMNVTFNTNVSENNYASILTSTDLKNEKILTFEKFDAARTLLDEFAPMSLVWLILGIFCCIICGILLIWTCCLWARISLATGRN